MKRVPKLSFALMLAAALGVAYHGATKNAGPRGGRITIDDELLVDAGSYLTNDTVHVAITAAPDSGITIPPETEILVLYTAATNRIHYGKDWTEFLPRLSFADFPHDYYLEGATNYDVTVFANYVPAPTVHTNGVWTMRGFRYPDDDVYTREIAPAIFAFPNTKTETKGAPE